MYRLWRLPAPLPGRGHILIFRNAGGYGMNICGLLIHGDPARLNRIVAGLRAIPGTQVHRTTEDGRMVVTAEDSPTHLAHDAIMAAHNVPGVLSVVLVYHNFEQDTAV